LDFYHLQYIGPITLLIKHVQQAIHCFSPSTWLLPLRRSALDGAYFRVHHFAAQLASPFPLLSAIGAKTNKIEIGTGVIDMRYENPMYMVEDAGAADLISGGRLQLGISRGSPEQVIDGWRHSGKVR
jgi:alkanesulfonate monooxygenase SsuD/methylene tetrahydromethanopterin reductase-like flavin-dependent oxidoreductase (luciferase family)